MDRGQTRLDATGEPTRGLTEKFLDQATDRAHRIGQSQPVTVYRLICESTVEERMIALQAKKAALMRESTPGTPGADLVGS